MQWAKGRIPGFLLFCLFFLSCGPRHTPPPPDSVIPPPSSPSVAPDLEATVERLEAAVEKFTKSRKPPPSPDPAIRQIQGILYEQGYNPGSLDGLMGEGTHAALRQFQRDHNLPETGQIDAATKAALLQ